MENTEKKKRLIFAIDFDGTIVKNAFPKIGELNQEVADFIKEIKKHNDQWILWTCRSGRYLEEALEFLKENGISPDKANEDIIIFKDNPEHRKLFAYVYIDDRNAGGLVLPDVYKNPNQGD